MKRSKYSMFSTKFGFWSRTVAGPFSRIAGQILMKIGKKEVFMVPNKCYSFSSRFAQGRFRAGNLGCRGAISLTYFFFRSKASATNRMHINNLKACWKKHCYFWFHFKFNHANSTLVHPIRPFVLFAWNYCRI